MYTKNGCILFSTPSYNFSGQIQTSDWSRDVYMYTGGIRADTGVGPVLQALYISVCQCFNICCIQWNCHLLYVSLKGCNTYIVCTDDLKFTSHLTDLGSFDSDLEKVN